MQLVIASATLPILIVWCNPHTGHHVMCRLESNHLGLSGYVAVFSWYKLISHPDVHCLTACLHPSFNNVPATRGSMEHANVAHSMRGLVRRFGSKCQLDQLVLTGIRTFLLTHVKIY